MKKRQFFFHGWLIVLTGILVYALGYGSRYSFSVIFPSLLEEFQWPRDITATMLSVHMLVYALIAPVAGSLVDKIGPRKTMASGIMILALGLALSGLGSKPWHFYLTFGVLSGAGLCLTGAVPFTIVIKNWFERKRGLALSLLFLGSGGAFVFYPAIAFLIDRVAWRNTFIIEGIFVSCLVLPLIILIIRYHPMEMGLAPDGVSDATEIPRSKKERDLPTMDQDWGNIDWTWSKAARTSRFWLLCLSTFSLWGIVQHIMVSHHVAFAIDVGYSQMYASSILSLFGILYACGSLAAAVSDRIGREPTMMIGTVFGMSGILALMFIRDACQPLILYYYAMTLGFGLGMNTPTIAASATDIFQGPRVGAIIGFIWFSFGIGGCIGPWLGGWIFEFASSYLLAFFASMFFYGVACAAIWFAAPRKVRLVPGRSRVVATS